MENADPNVENNETSQSQSPSFTFSSSGRTDVVKKRKFPVKLVLVIVVILVLFGGAVFFFLNLRSAGQTISSPSPTPSFLSNLPTLTPTPTSSLQRDAVKIKVLNGTGITGEAAFLQRTLSSLGYKNIEAGNAPSDDQETTTMSFAQAVSEQVRAEILAKLKSIYKEVKELTSKPSGGFDVEITTGLRTGVTKPTATPTKKPTTSVTQTPTPTGPTTTPTNTPTPTPAP